MECCNGFVTERHNGVLWSLRSSSHSTKPVYAIRVRIDVWRTAIHQFGDEFSGRGGHAQAEHVVTDSKKGVGTSRGAIDHGQTVPGHRPPAKPLLMDWLAMRLL